MSATAIQMLKEDHERIQALLEKLTATTDRGVKTRLELLRKLEQEIHEHTALEEEIVYPAFKREGPNKSDTVLYHEAKEEHRAADKVLKDLMRTDVATNSFGGKSKVLAELVKHHIEEEEQELFPRMMELLSTFELKDLGEQLLERRSGMRNGRAWDSAAAAV